MTAGDRLAGERRQVVVPRHAAALGDERPARDEQADGQSPHPLDPLQLAGDAIERGDLAHQPARVELVADLDRRSDTLAAAAPASRRRAARRAPRPSSRAAPGPRGARRPCAAAGRSATAPRLTIAVAALVEVDVALRRGVRAVRGRAEPADQRDLLERRGELGAEHAPLDAADVVERRLDRRPLALACGSTSAAGRGGRVPCRRRAPAVGVVEEVDAGPRRGAVDEAALRVDPPRPRRRELLELARASRRPAPARARSAAGRPRRSPARREARGGTAGRRRRRSTRARRGSSAPTRRPSRFRASGTVSITVACRRLPVIRSSSRLTKPTSKRALCATSTAPPANFENRRSASRTPGRAPELLVRQAGQDADRAAAAASSARRASGTRRAISSSRTRTAPISQMRADALARPVVSRSKTTNCARSPSERVGRRRERDERRRASRGARRSSTSGAEQRAREPLGRLPDREEERRGLARARPAAALLEKLDEPVERVDRELHRPDRYTNICSVTCARSSPAPNAEQSRPRSRRPSGGRSRR